MGTDGCLHKKKETTLFFFPFSYISFLRPPPTTIDVNSVYKPFSSLLCVA